MPTRLSSSARMVKETDYQFLEILGKIHFSKYFSMIYEKRMAQQNFLKFTLYISLITILWLYFKVPLTKDKLQFPSLFSSSTSLNSGQKKIFPGNGPARFLTGNMQKLR